MFKIILPYLELVLTGLGVLVIIITGWVAQFWEAHIWQVTTIAATLVGILHGLIFWSVRHRQHRVRQIAIGQVREMLKDLVQNRLQSIKMMVYLAQSPKTNPDTVAARLDQVQYLVGDISALIDHISEESLQKWRGYYAEVIDGIEAKVNQINPR
ncbi:hypothetical protein GlitD10_0597 [Gloeomargarita lithophora Alchichica-D10]|uniref:Uncharacterized protein n=1 Tax=Gloeomargarita lithophora Alchichica-D10 TaxID=1188229 RepID=A0A1J0AAF6_9CYAN|nr:hypothetical protein [Gloeomargarita lithophora]APB32911.1 hypothetical protein GlitD10_0597 [Gloeomargarita lithophora Alchichica-D10]